MSPSLFTAEDWQLRATDEPVVQKLQSALGVQPLTARFLTGRGFLRPEDAERYLRPELSDLPDPFQLPDMTKAVERISSALEGGERIAIFGDYDVDGVTGAALLADFLQEISKRPLTLLPHRMEHGYGISENSIDLLADQGASLIITVDNGTRAFAALARARERGIDVIITDHHELEAQTPQSYAFVNPKRTEENPFTHLSGCGVAFMLIMALRKQLRDAGRLPQPEPNLRRQLDFVALGTIADVVPLSGVNRILARYGLTQLALSERPGIRALLASSSTSPAEISPTTVGFRLAPRLNAAGRLQSAQIALDLLLAQELQEAHVIAAQLNALNAERQRIEQRILREAERMMEERDTSAAVVVHSKDWHLGVLGIVASKLASRSGRPTAVISRDVAPARGSLRSAGGIDLMQALAPCHDLMVQYGGHTLAAGLCLEEDRIEAFEERFVESCSLLGAGPPPRLQADVIARPSEITPAFMEELNLCEPFGIDNPEPIFILEDISIVQRRTVGNGHVKMTLRAGSLDFEAIAFGMAKRIPEDVQQAHIACTPQYNTWNGVTTIQLKVKDLVAT